MFLFFLVLCTVIIIDEFDKVFAVVVPFIEYRNSIVNIHKFSSCELITANMNMVEKIIKFLEWVV